MSISALVRHFEAIGRVPVQLPDVVKEFRRMMPNDNIRVTGVDISANLLRGAHYSYIHRPHPESALVPAPVVQIVYSLNQPLEWQRLVVCKELIHLFDNTGVETDQPHEVIRLIKALSGEVPKTIKSGGLHWFFDNLAEYQAMAVLFPFGLRETINGSKSNIDHDILAKKLQLPTRVVDLVMDDAWKSLRESMLLRG